MFGVNGFWFISQRQVFYFVRSISDVISERFALLPSKCFIVVLVGNAVPLVQQINHLWTNWSELRRSYFGSSKHVVRSSGSPYFMAFSCLTRSLVPIPYGLPTEISIRSLWTYAGAVCFMRLKTLCLAKIEAFIFACLYLFLGKGDSNPTLLSYGPYGQTALHPTTFSLILALQRVSS